MGMSQTGLRDRIKGYLKTDIIDPMGLTTEQANVMLAQMTSLAYAIARGVVEEIQANAVVTLPGASIWTVETYAAGVGDHGGSLVAGPNPVVGNVKATQQSGTVA